MKRLVVSAAARADLRNIARYSEREWGERRTTQYLSAIRERFGLLQRRPETGVTRRDIGGGYRSVPVGRHLVFYRIESRAVVIVRVLHQRRMRCSILHGEGLKPDGRRSQARSLPATLRISAGDGDAETALRACDEALVHTRAIQIRPAHRGPRTPVAPVRIVALCSTCLSPDFPLSRPDRCRCDLPRPIRCREQGEDEDIPTR